MESWAYAPRPSCCTNVRARSGGRRSPWRSILGFLDDAALLLLVVLLFPVAVPLIGTPVALLVRLIGCEIAGRGGVRFVNAPTCHFQWSDV